MSSEDQRELQKLSPNERRRGPNNYWDDYYEEMDSSERNTDEPADTSTNPVTDSSSHVKHEPNSEEEPHVKHVTKFREELDEPDERTQAPWDVFPYSPNSPDAQSSMPSHRDADKPLHRREPKGHRSPSSNNKAAKKRDPARRPKKVSARSNPPSSSHKHVILSSPRGLPPIPEVPAPCHLCPGRMSSRETTICGSLEDLPKLERASHAEPSDSGLVQRGRRPTRRSMPDDKEMEEEETPMDSSEERLVSYAVPFPDQLPSPHQLPFPHQPLPHQPTPGARSHGKATGKVKKRESREDEGESYAANQPLPSIEGPHTSKRTSSPPTRGRKRRSSSLSPSSPPPAKRSRSSTPFTLVLGNRLPLLFVAGKAGYTNEHRHVIIPLPVNWTYFRALAVEAFGRAPCGQEIPVDIPDQATFVMRWNRFANHKWVHNFPNATELGRENINAVLQWMLYSGSYDFCQIVWQQQPETGVKVDTISVRSGNQRNKIAVNVNKQLPVRGRSTEQSENLKENIRDMPEEEQK